MISSVKSLVVLLDKWIQGMATLAISGAICLPVGFFAGAIAGACSCVVSPPAEHGCIRLGPFILWVFATIAGGISGLLLAFPVGVLGTVMRCRAAWTILPALIVGVSIAAMCFGGATATSRPSVETTDISLWRDSLFVAYPVAVASLTGYFVGQEFEKKRRTYFRGWAEMLEQRGWYETTLVERLVSLLLLCGTCWGVYQFIAALVITGIQAGRP